MIGALLPASIWYKAGTLGFSSAREGEPIFIFYQGGPVRPFMGSYTVTMRDFKTGAIACEARGGPFNYKPGTPRPEPLTMDWWAPGDERCWSPPAGTYAVETCWSIWSAIFGFLPRKHVCTQPAWLEIRPHQERIEG